MSPSAAVILVRWYRLLFGATGGEWHEGTLAGMGLSRAHPGVEGAEGHHSSRRSIMEAAALDATHVDVAFVHERFDEKGERFAAGPKRGIGPDMRPEGFHQLEAAADIGDDLWQDCGTTTCQHAQGHIGARTHHLHELLQGEIGRDGFVAVSGVLEQGEGIAERGALANREE